MGTTKELAANIAVPEVGRLTADLTTQVNSLGVDQQSFPASSAVALVVWEVTTGAGAAGDQIDFTVDIDDSADNSSWTTQKTYSVSVTVDANNFEHYGTLCVPVNNVNGLRQYYRATAVVAAGTGAPTISASAASVTILPMDLASAPESSYDVDGFERHTITTS